MATKRSKKPSNAVKKAATVGSVLAGMGGTALAWAQQKYQLDGGTVAYVGSFLGQLIALGTAWKAQGGRVGEPQ